MQASVKKLFTTSSVSAIAVLAFTAPAFAAEEKPTITAWEASRTIDDSDMVTTGVARGRDRLSSATSTSSIKENEITRIAPRSLAELFRNIPGIRVEAGAGESQNNYTVRGLPMVNSGNKYLQFQEDGMPVMEFGDLQGVISDAFIRADFNVSQVESIRGGSASTFASNAPGGVINLISKTGEVEGGSVMGTIGVDFESYRTDFDYGGQLGNGWRFHIGGFYREGEGPRETGMNSMRGGQVKLNVTKQFNGGFIRFYAKLLDDKTPYVLYQPVLVTGTNSSPKFTDPVGIDSRTSSLASPFLGKALRLGTSGKPSEGDLSDGIQVNAKSIGFDSQFSIGEWSVSERFRYADQSTSNTLLFAAATAPAAAFATGFAGPGATLTYAAGPRAGQAFNAANGNGLATLSVISPSSAPDVSNMTNDLRVSRVWKVGGGDLTTTGGLYRSSQKYMYELGFRTILQDAVGGGQSVPLDLQTATGLVVSENGTLIYGSPSGPGYAKNIDMNYQITAPFGSFNFAKGKIAVGGSVRWDNVRAQGSTIADESVKIFDLNGNGNISIPENRVGFIPSGASFPVNYKHDYLSYSVSLNYRFAESLAMFARYSRGGRAGADKILFTPAISTTTGALINDATGHDTVRQAEVGLKFRRDGVVLNLTGFHAKTDESNTQFSTDPVTGISTTRTVFRSYQAYGLELEGGFRHGPLSLSANATYTEAEIRKAENPALQGNTPRNQPKLLFSLRPQYDSDKLSFGAIIIGTTGSFAQDVNQLRLPGFTTVGGYVQYRPMKNVELSVNGSNLLNARAITETLDSAIPPAGVAMIRTMYARTITTSLRFFY